MTLNHMNRRQAMASLLAISAAGSLAACNQIEAEPELVSGLNYAAPLKFFRDDEMALIGALADTIIPATDTPGAIAANVPDTVQGLASEWGDNGFRLFAREGLAALNNALSSDGASFVDMAAEQRAAILSAYDSDVFSGEIEDDFYKSFKNTVATAYYMSEIGATQELAYEPVPGEWIGDAPLTDFPKTWAT